MSEEQRADCRAQGALDNFLIDMATELRDRMRSPEYSKAFWDTMHNALRNASVQDYRKD